MKLAFSFDHQSHTLDLSRSTPEEYEFELNGEMMPVQVISITPPRITFSFKGKIITARVVSDENKRWVHVDGTTLVLERAETRAARTVSQGGREGTGSGIVVAPMPGQ